MKKSTKSLSGIMFCAAAFFIPSLIMLGVYALRGVYPFGGNSVLVLDLNAQYIYYYETFRDAILGDSSLFYSFGRTLGGEMAGIFAYYLASPFMVVLLFFPKAMIVEAVLVMILLKIGAAGLTFYFFLHRQRGTRRWTALMFCVLYALMSYMTVQTMNPMWLDALVLLPLIAMAVERFVKNGSFAMLSVTLTVLFISNFYIGYMTGIFVFFYFLYFMLRDKPDSYRQAVGKTLRFLGVAALSVLMSLWLILPTLYSLSFGKLGFSSPNFIPSQQLDLFDILSKILPYIYDSVNYHGRPFIYCGTLALVLCGYYFAAPLVSARRKAVAAAFIGICLAAFAVSTLDIVLHGFQPPNWLNYRYSFVLSFFILVLAVEAFELPLPMRSRHGAQISALFCILFIVLGRFKYDYIIPEISIWLGIAGILSATALVFAIKRILYKPYVLASPARAKSPVAKLRIAAAVLALIVAAEAAGNTWVMLEGANKEVVYSTRSSYLDYFDRLYPALDFIHEKDSGFFRTETMMRRTVNDPMALNINGISHSSSTLNSHIIDFMYRLGFASKEHWTRYKGATILSNTLLGVKYILAEESPGQMYRNVYEKDDVQVYENTYALPIAYSASRRILEMTLDGDDPFMSQNKFLSTLLGRMYTQYFKLADIREILFENIRSVPYEGYVSYQTITKGKNAHIEYVLTPAGENELYMYLVSPYKRKVNVWLEGEFVATYFDYETICILPLGAHPDKDSISVITTPIENDYFLASNMFYYLDTGLFEAGLSDLARGAADVIRYSDTHLQINATVGSNSVLFTTIPYDMGWSVYVNGQRSEAVRTETGLLAVDTGEGTHTVVLKFVPYGFIPGLIVSLAAAAILITLLLLRRRKQMIKAAAAAAAAEETDENAE